MGSAALLRLARGTHGVLVDSVLGRRLVVGVRAVAVPAVAVPAVGVPALLHRSAREDLPQGADLGAAVRVGRLVIAGESHGGAAEKGEGGRDGEQGLLGTYGEISFSYAVVLLFGYPNA